MEQDPQDGEWCDVPYESDPTFTSFTDEMHYLLTRSEFYARRAHDLCYIRGGPRRSLWYKTVLGRAQKILAGLAKEEQQRKAAEDEATGEEVPHQNNSS